MIALRDHHRVEHDVLRLVTAQRIGDRASDRRVRKHADLHRVDADVVEHGVELRGNEARVRRVNRGDAARVLRGQRRDHARAIGAERGEGLQIGLDAGAAAGIGTGDRQHIGNRLSHGKARKEEGSGRDVSGQPARISA